MRLLTQEFNSSEPKKKQEQKLKQKQLSELTKQWYQKLKDEGFVDIEESFQYHALYFAQAFGELRHRSDSRLDYHERAISFLELYEFEDDTEKKLWAMHTMGHTQRQICKDLNLSKGAVYRTIKNLTGIMKEAIL